MKPLLSVLDGNSLCPPPMWVMRQAGRYLPEYREVRKQAGSFLNLCYNPDLASKVTLQPIERFGFDAAIIFSDILVIPHALGTDLDYIEGTGPVLSSVDSREKLKELSSLNIHKTLAPVYETLSLTKSRLPSNTTLIGFAGAPWTVATYMIEGGSSNDYPKAKKLIKEDKETFLNLIDMITNSTIEYLCRQVEAGAEVIQLFDSWAADVPPENFNELVIEPAKKIVNELRREHPQIKIIGFPKGIGERNKQYLEIGVDALSIGTEEDRKKVVEKIQSRVAVQGNMSPETLLNGTKEDVEKEALEVLRDFANGPHIFNLGHGILPKTPIENVEKLVEVVRGFAGEKEQKYG